MSGISGFPEWLPGAQLAFEHIVTKIRANFELHGFCPMDTPAMERISTLVAKGNDKEIYGIHRLIDGDQKKELALRFDLTVPLARYVAQHYGQLSFPFRRYHIAPVWRGERAQAGRYRQFYQCDVDVVGDGILEQIYDAEMLSIIYSTLISLNVPSFCVVINDMSLLTELIKACGVTDIVPVMRILDKVDKISAESMRKELSGYVADIDSLIRIVYSPSTQDSINDTALGPLIHTRSATLRQTIDEAVLLGVPREKILFSPTLARGLNYYTGIIYETKFIDYPELGSICSGGRYDNLADGFTKKKLPGVGMSIGISRLFGQLLAKKMITSACETPALVLVTTQNRERIEQYITLAGRLRSKGIKTELYMSDHPLTTQMKYASKKGFAFVIIANASELTGGNIVLRDMLSGDQSVMTIEDAIIAIA